MSTLCELPIFALDTVLFPRGLLPLRVFEQRYLDMTKTCIRDNAPFGVCLIRAGAEVGAPAVTHPVGCTASILRWDMPHLGLFHLVAEGGRVFRILEQWHTRNGLLCAQVEMVAPAPQIPLPERFAPLAQLLTTAIDKLGAERFPAPIRLDDAAWVAYRLSETLPFDADVRQLLLETSDPLAALERLRALLQAKALTL